VRRVTDLLFSLLGSVLELRCLQQKHSVVIGLSAALYLLVESLHLRGNPVSVLLSEFFEVVRTRLQCLCCSLLRLSNLPSVDLLPYVLLEYPMIPLALQLGVGFALRFGIRWPRANR
jgi:hypothetical protein